MPLCKDCRNWLIVLPYLMKAIETMKKDIEDLKAIEVGTHFNHLKSYCEALKVTQKSVVLETAFQH